jgi:hypothetical protein
MICDEYRSHVINLSLYNNLGSNILSAKNTSTITSIEQDVHKYFDSV